MKKVERNMSNGERNIYKDRENVQESKRIKIKSEGKAKVNRIFGVEREIDFLYAQKE